MSRRLGAPILRRELGRLGRRWTVHATRLAVVLLASLALGIALASSGAVSPDGGAARLGQSASLALFVILLAMTAVMVPLQFALAISDERAAGSLDLLMITGRSPRRVLAEIIGGRALNTLTLLLGATPLLALSLTLGGVAPPQFVAGLLVVLALVPALGGVAVLIATASRGVVLPLVLTGAWSILFLFLIPLRWAILLSPAGPTSDATAWLAPVMLVYEGVQSLGQLGGLGLWVLVGAHALAIGAWRFRRFPTLGPDAASQASFPGPRSGWIVSAALLAATWTLGEWVDREAFLAFDREVLGASVPGSQVMLYGACWLLSHDLFARALAWLLPRLDSPVERRFNLGPLALAALGPILWRELWTAGQGGLARIVWALTGGWALIAILLVVASDLEVGVVRGWSVFGAWGAALLGAVLVGLSVTEERARRTLPLLALSRIGPGRLLRSTVLGALIKAGPIMLLTAGTWIVLGASPGGPGAYPGLPEVARWLGTLSVAAWYALSAVSLLALNIGLAAAIPRVGVARTLPVAVSVVALPALFFVAGLAYEVRWYAVSYILFPWFRNAPLAPEESALLIGSWTVVAGGLLALAWLAVGHRMRVGEGGRG